MQNNICICKILLLYWAVYLAQSLSSDHFLIAAAGGANILHSALFYGDLYEGFDYSDP